MNDNALILMTLKMQTFMGSEMYWTYNFFVRMKKRICFFLFFFFRRWVGVKTIECNIKWLWQFIWLSFIKMYCNWSCYPLFRVCFLTKIEKENDVLIKHNLDWFRVITLYYLYLANIVQQEKKTRFVFNEGSSDWGITYNYVLSRQNVDIWWICQLRLDSHYVCMKILLYDYINNKMILENWSMILADLSFG